MMHIFMNYELLRADLLIKGAHWVFMPFKDKHNLEMLRKDAKKKGKVDVLGTQYSLEDIDRLALEEGDKVCEFRFEAGSNEGYVLTLLFEKGQVVRAKTFDEDFFNKMYQYFNKKYSQKTIVA
jgi:hypothetical protein